MKNMIISKEFFLVLIGMFLFSVAGAHGVEESITLTTYYPSPYGVYSEMRLYPKASAICNNQQEGLMFYNDTLNQLMVCGQDASGNYVWQPVSGLWTLSGTNLYPNDNNWNVGIGTTSPPGGYKLYVNGDVGWSGTLLPPSTVPWLRLTSFPAACPGGQYARGVGGALTCDTAIRTVNGMDGPDIRIEAGTNITISNAGDTVTISSSGGGGPGGGNVTIYAGPGIAVSPNPITNTGTVSFATQPCPDGQFVSGIDGGVGITCAAPSGGGGGGALGAWSGMLQANVVYTAATDGFVTATSSEGGDENCRMQIETPAGIIRQVSRPNHDGVQIALASPVRKGDTWQVWYGGGCGSVGNEVRIYWIPLGS